MAITTMTFMSPPEEQWTMILEAVRQALDDEDLANVAAGPIEGLLGQHGRASIIWIELEAAVNVKLARAMTGVWKHMMPDDVWARVQALKSRVSDPLRKKEGPRT